MMAQAYFPRQAGGVQTVTKALVRSLRARGHEAAVAAELSFRGTAGLKSAAGLLLGGGRYAQETYDEAPVFRARHIARQATAILAAFRPDAVVVQSMDAMPLARAVDEAGCPLVICWHDVETHRMGGSPAGLRARFIANSAFTAGVYARDHGVRSVVIPPLIERAAYETVPGPRSQVTFVNPVPDKGLDLAIAIAASCPDIPFEFVESWILESAPKAALLARLAALPNIRFTPHQTSMRPIYARTRLLLAPSQWQEAWGRVASEAHVSGIPVIGARIGGLVESIGPGGILVAPDAPPEAWVAALRSLWGDPVRYAALSAQALAYADRQALDPDWAIGALLGEIEAARALRRTPAAPQPA